MQERRIHLQSELNPRSLVLACAEGLLGELIKNARLGFADMATELPLHHTVQLIASARGYHHHHEYPVILTKGQGDHKRLDFVFAKVRPSARNHGTKAKISDAVAVEMKVVGRRSRNKPDNGVANVGAKTKKYKSVTKDVAKIKHFLSTTARNQDIGYAAGYLMVVNLDVNSGVCWDVQASGGLREQDVRLLRRFSYSCGLIHKSVTVYEIVVP